MNPQKRAELERRKAFTAMASQLKNERKAFADKERLLQEAKRLLANVKEMMDYGPMTRPQRDSKVVDIKVLSYKIGSLIHQIDKPGTGMRKNTLERPRPQVPE